MSTLSHPPFFDAETVDQHRRDILAGIGLALARFSRIERESRENVDRAPVWSHDTTLGDPVSLINPGGSHLRVEWPKGLAASIAVRLGEVRIGLLIPNSQLPDIAALNSFYPYPEDRASQLEFPARLIRRLGDAQSLVDFIFSARRFADLDLTVRALGGGPVEKALLIDSIAHETAHISSALVHHLSTSGVYFGDGISTDLEPHIFTSNHPDPGPALGLTPAQMYLIGPTENSGARKWMAFVPPAQVEDFTVRLQAIQGEEMESTEVPALNG